ncbi:hypothetical protein DSCO28_30250 [Desulfosarcina ovata subsp. sediminis]|uniref:Uncharacterized protein n=1 Tax=Desulfosarcina ovata subsp. sediminis TaxID=885957 RepID=A0A5K7ZQD7_9BACT|nr:hypothetical protein DSCO28_30250 [Desulfosarcina ovata subsp. sediminis]
MDKLTVAGEGAFKIDLPEGVYTFVASSDGMETVRDELYTDTPTIDIEFSESSE